MKQQIYEIDGEKVIIEISPEIASLLGPDDLQKLSGLIKLERKWGWLFKLEDGSWIAAGSGQGSTRLVLGWDTFNPPVVIPNDGRLRWLYLASKTHAEIRERWWRYKPASPFQLADRRAIEKGVGTSG